VSGAGFSISPTALPVTLNAGQILTITVRFDPTSSGTVSGTLQITTNSNQEPSATVALSGTGAGGGTPTLSLSATSLNFGNDTVGTPELQALTLSSSGTAPVTVSSATIAGTGFSMSGATFPVTLNPGIAITMQVQFDPAATGTDSGTITFSSNSSTGGSARVSLSGTGTAAHQVSLSWVAPANSPDSVAGYNVYRAALGSSSFQLLNPSVDAQTTYSDKGVESGLSYTYYVKSVDGSGNTSVPSTEVTVTIP
jgi:hypothetical protein